MAKKPSKTAFVRALPHTVSAKDVVAKAKAAGFKISEAYVYTIRSTTKRKGNGRSKTVPPSGSPEVTFRTLVLQLGVVRARALLSDVEAKLARLIAG